MATVLRSVVMMTSVRDVRRSGLGPSVRLTAISQACLDRLGVEKLGQDDSALTHSLDNTNTLGESHPEPGIVMGSSASMAIMEEHLAFKVVFNH